MVKHFFKKYENVIKILIGIACFVFQQHIYKEFSILFGLFLLERGLHRSYSAWKAGEAFSGKSQSFELGIIVACIAVGILILRNEALIVAGMFWGISSLVKSSKYLNVVLYQYTHNKKIPIRHLLAFIIEFVLGMILIFDTLDSIPHHILILGVELIVESLIEIYLGIFKKKTEDAVEAEVE